MNFRINRHHYSIQTCSFGIIALKINYILKLKVGLTYNQSHKGKTRERFSLHLVEIMVWNHLQVFGVPFHYLAHTNFSVMLMLIIMIHLKTILLKLHISPVDSMFYSFSILGIKWQTVPILSQLSELNLANIHKAFSLL